MTRRNINELNRRDFVTGTVAAAVGIGSCFSVGARKAIAYARATGKILLMAEDLNRLFKERYEAGQIKALAREMARDTIAWLRKECSLTPIQEKRIAAFTADDWNSIKEVLRFVEEAGGTLSLAIWDPPSVRDPYTMKLTAQANNPNGTITTREATVRLKS